MAGTVIEAFIEFMKETVNLDVGVSDRAKGSRDWLMDRIHSFTASVPSFPRLYQDIDIFFGSFERKTKKRELDDIDLMVGLSADGATYSTSWGSTVYLIGPKDDSPLCDLLHDNGVHLNSRRVINKFLNALEDVPQYEKADIHRRGEAATLSLQSYPWVFDIVPCFKTKEEADGKTYYLIPDGNGHWKKTDPVLIAAECSALQLFMALRC